MPRVNYRPNKGTNVRQHIVYDTYSQTWPKDKQYEKHYGTVVRQIHYILLKGVSLCQIDLTQPLVPQGPFDVIVQKLSDVIVEAEHDSQSQQLLVNFQVKEPLFFVSVRSRLFWEERWFCMSLYACSFIQSYMLEVRRILRLSFTLQSYVSAHPSTVLLDPLPAMTQLLDRFASYRIMSKLHNSIRGELQLFSVYCVVYCCL